MLIWLFQIGETLPLDPECRKMRTALLADILVERGHNVVWWAGAYEHQSKRWIVPRDYDVAIHAAYMIKMLKGFGYRDNISLRRYADHLRMACKFSAIADFQKKPDIVLASMPCYHLAFEAMNYCRKHRVPLVVDVRDPWPDIFIEKIPAVFKPLLRFALKRDFAKVRRMLAQADSITAVSSGFLKWAQDMARRRDATHDRVFYHGYMKSIYAPTANRPLSEASAPKKQFIFVGTFGVSYELTLLIDCAKNLMAAGRKDIILYIAGAGEQFEEIAERSRGLPNVVLPGWIGAQKIRQELETSWAGIVPCKSADHTLPNKVFEYLSASLPIISSLEGEVKNLIATHSFGLNYQVGDAKTLLKHILRLADDFNLWSKMSSAAGRFFEEHGDARIIYNRYVDHIEDIHKHFNSAIASSAQSKKR